MFGLNVRLRVLIKKVLLTTGSDDSVKQLKSGLKVQKMKKRKY